MSQYHAQLASISPAAITGTVVRSDGATIAVAGFPAPVGAIARVERASGAMLEAEVIGFRDELSIISPYGEVAGVRRGDRVRLAKTVRSICVGNDLLGRVIDAHGRPIDGRGEPLLAQRQPLNQSPPRATERPRISDALSTGVRVLDGLLTCGRGQRLGVFAGSGVGKSVLLGMMARGTAADVRVIALIGERGREVNEFIQRDLGAEALARSVVVVATSDQPAVARVQAAQTATSVAEYFRDQGQNVLLLMDSLTRFAMAQREIGLAAGEPPTTRGYPPSVFAWLPRLVERAGRSSLGSITAYYTVLVEGDDMNEPVSDAVRGLLDGHIVLSRKLASQGHYPAIDVLSSISRVMPDVTTAQHQEAARAIRQLLAAYREHADLISIGAYQRGANPMVDLAIERKEEIDKLLQQAVGERCTLDETRKALLQLASRCVPAVGGQRASASTATHEPKM
jgi:flagellum-specific ATP synthase